MGIIDLCVVLIVENAVKTLRCPYLKLTLKGLKRLVFTEKILCNMTAEATQDFKTVKDTASFMTKREDDAECISIDRWDAASTR